MASIGRISGSLLSATNETTLALLNVNVDFSVLRCDPSPEYAPVGSALTKMRRHQAESGSIHSTACRLGFLFHEMVPNTPKLLKAYGTRVSEILSRPDINPEGSERDGPFQAFIGADCTSIWAAATSGTASLGVLLLACMLSRAWDAKAATSIWVEIIENRQRQVKAQISENKIVHPHSVAAAEQDIGRPELAEWDASVRSWLRRADLYMKFGHTQFRLIIDNLNIPYTSTGSTFEKVTMAWVRSMEVIERLLDNLPQQALDRAILLAISSWHLYPDLLVFQEEAKKIPFKDGLFPSSGVLSLGLEYKGPADNMTRWSLALSHLRYYGDPVPVWGSDDNTRIRIEKLWLVTLGAIFRQWDIPYSNSDQAVDWFTILNNILSTQQGVTEIPEISWVLRLCAAAASVGKESTTFESDRSLIRYGWRRGENILGGDDKAIHSPYFGLCCPHILSALGKPHEVDSGLEYLRGIASQMQLQAHDAFIEYHGNLDSGTTYTERTTIEPIEPHLGLRPGEPCPQENPDIPSKKHVRWVWIDSYSTDHYPSHLIESRSAEIQQTGEICYNSGEMREEEKTRKASGCYQWDEPPRLFADKGRFEFRRLPPFRQMGSVGFYIWVALEKQKNDFPADLPRRATTSARSMLPLPEALRPLQDSVLPQNLVQYLKESMRTNRLHVVNVRPTMRLQNTVETRQGTKRKRLMDEDIAANILHSESPESRETSDVGRHQGVGDGTFRPDIGGFYLMSGACNRSIKWLMALRVLETVTQLYEQFPGVTVSLRLAEQNLLKAKWLPQGIQHILNGGKSQTFGMAAHIPATTFLLQMTRASSFSCIAMLESGSFNLDPDQLEDAIALCSENSIFVAGILLSDPSHKSHGTQIRHLVGNVGHSGMVFMVSPLEPRIRPISHNPQLVEHRPYDGRRIDSFRGTSLHLSFTTLKIPLLWKTTGEIDQDIFLLESVVSVQDNGKWVADINVVEMEQGSPDVIERFCRDNSCNTVSSLMQQERVSVDSWEELLDPPPCIGVFRSRGNWVARLAAACILSQQGKANSAVIVGDENICWNCLTSIYDDPEPHIPELILH